MTTKEGLLQFSSRMFLRILVKYNVFILLMIFFFDIIQKIEYNKQNTNKNF